MVCHRLDHGCHCWLVQQCQRSMTNFTRILSNDTPLGGSLPFNNLNHLNVTSLSERALCVRVLTDGEAVLPRTTISLTFPGFFSNVQGLLFPSVVNARRSCASSTRIGQASDQITRAERAFRQRRRHCASKTFLNFHTRTVGMPDGRV